MTSLSSASALVLGAAFGLVLLSGCGGGSASANASEAPNLKPLAVFYGQFIAQHQGQPPASEAEFKAFVQSDQRLREALGVEDPNAIFISPRDSKPYVVVYGSTTGPAGPGGQPVIAYEQEGVGGKRYVANSLGQIEEVEEAKLREWVPGVQ